MNRREFLGASTAMAALTWSAELRAHARRTTVLELTGRLPWQVAFRRASPASLWDGEALREHRADAPRFVHRAGQPLGLLLEAQSENVVGSAATPVREAGACETERAPLAPDGKQWAFRLPCQSTSEGNLYEVQADAMRSHGLLTASVWLRTNHGKGTWGLLLRDVATYNAAPLVALVDEQWRRYSVTLDSHEGDARIKQFLVTHDDRGPGKGRPDCVFFGSPPWPAVREYTPHGLSLWGLQMEWSGSATSHIPCTNPGSTRAADELTFSAELLNAESGSLTFVLPEGGTRSGVLLDANGSGSGLYLGYSSSGWLEARIGAVSLNGFVDATGHHVVHLEWRAGEGAQLSSGPSRERMRPCMSVSAPFSPPELGPRCHLGTSGDGQRGLNRPLARVEIAEALSRFRGGKSRSLPSFVPAGYELVFGDDFDRGGVERINEDATGGSVDAPAWRSRYRQPRRDVTNQEKQIYMDPAFSGTADHALGVQPFSMRESVLTISAQPADPVSVAPYIWNYRYTSGVITSEYTHWQTYGYFEMRARLPLGRGFWPAFWLLPKGQHYKPELDVFEASGTRPFAFRPAFSFPGSSSMPGYGCWMRQLVHIHDHFHVYALEWTPDNLVFSVDGNVCLESGRHPVHEDMYLLANLGLGSHDPNWIPDPDQSTPFPGLLEIDYIRAYQRASGSRRKMKP